MRDIFARQMLRSASTLAVLPGYAWLLDDILNWLQPAIAAINQYACCKNTYFVEKKVKGSNGHVYPLPWGNSKNAQNPTRNFQKCTTLYEKLTTMHKIPRGTSKYAQNPTRIFQKCTKSHDWLRIMHKILWLTAKMYTIPWGTLKYPNPTGNFQKCTNPTMYF